MLLRRGEVVLVNVQFHQSPGGKIRPGVVVFDCADSDFVAVPITSQNRLGEFECPIRDWSRAGLNVPATARIHNPAVLIRASIRRRLGELTIEDLSILDGSLCRAFCPPQALQG
jgi:mRNA-degrading endonuclease toxin of MazEF toxin-antitoxin module